MPRIDLLLAAVPVLVLAGYASPAGAQSAGPTPTIAISPGELRDSLRSTSQSLRTCLQGAERLQPQSDPYATTAERARAQSEMAESRRAFQQACVEVRSNKLYLVHVWPKVEYSPDSEVAKVSTSFGLDARVGCSSSVCGDSPIFVAGPGSSSGSVKIDPFPLSRERAREVDILRGTTNLLILYLMSPDPSRAVGDWMGGTVVGVRWSILKDHIELGAWGQRIGG